MPFNFEEVYLVTNPSGNFMRSPMIALGVRPVRDRAEHSDDFVNGWQFLVDNDAHGGHQILGSIVRDEGGVIEVRDIDKRGDDKKPVVWRFEPLTLPIWYTYARKAEVGGYDELKATFRHDNDLRDFYHEKYLDPTVWTEFQRT
jgi:hypothetical protein